MSRLIPSCSQSGVTYVEVMVAVALIALSLVPAVEALHTGVLANDVAQSATRQHYALLAKMENVLAEPYSSLLDAAAAAGNQTTPGSYSDVSGVANRVLVFTSLYDANNADADGNAFTVLDPNLDGDNDPYTGYDELLWVRAEIENSAAAIESLVAR